MKKTVFAALAILFATTGAWAKSESSLKRGYSQLKEDLKSELTEEIPEISSARKSAYFDALEKEAEAKEALKAVQEEMAGITRAKALVGHAKNHWIKKADKGIAEAKAKLKAAESDAERAEASLRGHSVNLCIFL